MILVDSSVWIDYFTGIADTQTDKLDQVLGKEPVAVGDLILTEVLQGFRHDRDYQMAKNLFSDVEVFDMLGKDIAIKSADNFRVLRKRGITIRKTADVIIATFCIERGLPLLFSDKGFKPFVNHFGLTEV
ncbi:type II toxin-antitoxin system VapC family toxin [Aequoribacter sp.]|uniref:type II toxin-antitoxin system VapC family toxin n=1 Tax=Aequoribacter sp. TaxID=2847771 RepID=UPI003F69DB7A